MSKTFRILLSPIVGLVTVGGATAIICGVLYCACDVARFIETHPIIKFYINKGTPEFLVIVVFLYISWIGYCFLRKDERRIL